MSAESWSCGGHKMSRGKSHKTATLIIRHHYFQAEWSTYDRMCLYILLRSRPILKGHLRTIQTFCCIWSWLLVMGALKERWGKKKIQRSDFSESLWFSFRYWYEAEKGRLEDLENWNKNTLSRARCSLLDPQVRSKPQHFASMIIPNIPGDPRILHHPGLRILLTLPTEDENFALNSYSEIWGAGKLVIPRLWFLKEGFFFLW